MFPSLGGTHSLESVKKVGFLEWRDCWFCKVSVRSMRKLLYLSVFMPLFVAVCDSLQETVNFKTAGLQARLY